MATKTRGHVYFRIDGEWLTGHVQNLWAEGSYGKALATLDAAFPEMSFDTRLHLLSGHKGLVGENDMTLVDTEPQLRHGMPLLTLSEVLMLMCLRMQTSEMEKDEMVMAQNVGMAYESRENLRKLRYRIDNMKAEAYCLKHRKPRDEVPDYVKGYYANIDPDRDDDDEGFVGEYAKRQISDMAKLAAMTMGGGNAALADGAMKAADRLLGLREDEICSDPWPYESSLKAQSGWLDRNGELYGCEYMQHNDLTDAIIKRCGFEDEPAILEKKQWVKLSANRWHTCHVRKLSKRQKDFILDWCSHNKDVPIEDYLRKDLE